MCMSRLLRSGAQCCSSSILDPLTREKQPLEQPVNQYTSRSGKNEAGPHWWTTASSPSNMKCQTRCMWQTIFHASVIEINNSRVSKALEWSAVRCVDACSSLSVGLIRLSVLQVFCKMTRENMAAYIFMYSERDWDLSFSGPGPCVLVSCSIGSNNGLFSQGTP